MRRHLRTLLIASFLTGCSGAPSGARADDRAEHPERFADPPVGERLELSEAEWRARLTPSEHAILREQDTEPAFSGRWHDHHGHGTYRCAGCGAPLFSSDHKFDSGTGWPSFWRPIAEGRVGREVDRSYGITRTEVHCARCGGHLGHVFEDGPPPTGLRYCINSISLDFDARD